MGIYDKIFDIAKNLKAVERDREIGTTKGAYKITSYESILDAVRPLMLDRGLILIRTTAKATLSGNICMIEAEYDVVDTESGEKVKIASIGAGHDTSDKHAGKAMTYAMKYAFRDLFMLKSADGDDPDLSSSEKNNEQDVKAILSVQYLTDLMQDAVIKGNVTQEAADDFIAKHIRPLGTDQVKLEKARGYIRSTLGV